MERNRTIQIEAQLLKAETSLGPIIKELDGLTDRLAYLASAVKSGLNMKNTLELIEGLRSDAKFCSKQTTLVKQMADGSFWSE